MKFSLKNLSFLRTLLVSSFGLFMFNSVLNAQYCLEPTSNETIFPSTSTQYTASYSSGSRAFNFSAVAGGSYTFATCGLSSGDTYLRLYSTGTGGTELTYNDDGCSSQSTITWVCSTSGTYSVLLTDYSCDALYYACQMSYICSSCAAITCQTCPAYDFSITPTTSWQTHTSSIVAGGCKKYSLNLTAGNTYYLSACAADGGSASYDSYFILYNSSCTQVASNDDNCGSASYISYTPVSSGTYYFEVNSCCIGGSGGNYTLAYKYDAPILCQTCPAYDYSISPTTTYQTTSAAIPISGCKIYQINMTAGNTYRFTECEGGGSFSGGDPYLTLFNSSCSTVASNDDYCGLGSQLDYTPATSGTYYLKIHELGQDVAWTYTLAYKYTVACTTPGTPTSLSGSGASTTTANLSWAAGTPVGSATVTYYWNLYTSGATWVTSGNTTGTSATASGLSCGSSYYFTVYSTTSCNGTSSGTATSGTFSTSACPAPGCGNTYLGALSFSACSPQDVAYTSGTIPYWIFNATAGTTYNFSLGGQNLEDSYIHLYNSSLTEVASNDDSGPFYSGTPSSMSYTCPTSGTYYITACHYSCSSFSNSSYLTYWSTNAPYGSSSLTSITPTTSWQNSAYSNGSIYMYQFSATSGFTYDFSLCSNTEDSYLRIYNSTYDLQFSNDDAGPWCGGVPSSASWTAPTTANYIIEISHLGCVGFSNSGNLAYKYVDPCTTPGTPTSLSGSGASTTTANLSWAVGSPVGSATVTYYWNLYTSGATWVTSGNTTSTSATASGLSCGSSYYFSVYATTSCNGTSSGTATSGTFSTSACPAPGCGTTNLGTIAFSACTPQDVAYTSGTIPYWTFTATAGITYNFSLGSQNSEDSYLHLYNSSLTEVASNDDSGPFYSGTPSSLSYTCPTSGTYYITACHYTCTAFSNSSYMTYWSSNAPYGTSSLTSITPTTTWQNAAYSTGNMYLYQFAATSGTVYDFSLCDNSEDSYIRIYNSTYDLQFSNDDAGPFCSGVPSSASWTAPSSANYVIEISHLGCNGFANSGNLAYRYINPCTNPEALGVWTGCTSNDWNTATNWGQNTVPTLGIDAVISSTASNQPIVNATCVCNNITINAGASLTISGSNTLTVNGNWTNSGTFTPANGTVIFNGANQTISGNTNFWFVRFNGSGTKSLTTGTYQTNNSSDAIFGTPDMTVASGVTLLVQAGVTWSTMAPYGFQISGTLTINGGTFNCSATNGYGISPNNDSWLAGSVLNVSAGLFHGSIDADFGGSTINLSGGSIEIDDDIWGSGTLNQSGGNYRNTTSGGQFNINGGTLTGGTIRAYSDSFDRGFGVFGNTTATAAHTIILEGSAASNIPRINAIVQLGNVQVNNTSNLYISAGSLSITGNLLINATKTLNSQNYDFSVAGNWTNNGTYTPGTNTVTFNGTSGTSTITSGGTGSEKQFYNLTVNSSNIVDLLGDITINNNYTLNNSNQYNCQSYTMNVAGNWTRNGGQFNRGTGTVILTGLTKNIAGLETIFRNLEITGSYSQTATKISLMRTSSVGGDLRINAGASLNAQSNLIDIEGNWTNLGTFNCGTSTVNFKGNLNQIINPGSTNDFYNIILTNTAAGNNDIYINQPMDVTNNATFTNGIVSYTGTGALTFGNTATASVSSNNSFVNGLVTKTGSSNFVFPTGDIITRDLGDGNIEYVVLGALGITPSASATITTEYFYTNQNGMPDWWEHGGNMDENLHHVSDREHWLVNSNINLNAGALYWFDNSHSVGSTCIHGFDYGNPGDFNAGDLSVAYWSGSMWVDAGGDATGQNHNQGVINSSEIIPFGAKSQKYITFGSKNNLNPLPVELLSFDAKCNNSTAQITWQTASEINNDFFIVEKSNDLVNFFEFARVDGAGNSNIPLSYSITDDKLFSGDNYYRLKQIDFDGRITIYNVISVNCDRQVGTEPTMMAYPNPFTDELNVVIEGLQDDNFVLEIYDNLGQVVYSQEYKFADDIFKTTLNLKELRPAVYNLRSKSEGNVMNVKVVKK